jgi:hypothetical protein
VDFVLPSAKLGRQAFLLPSAKLGRQAFQESQDFSLFTPSYRVSPPDFFPYSHSRDRMVGR